MWVLKKVRIKNFRSIVDGEFSPGNITVIVGENDVGKSNYIRALNLFFNGETEPGRQFDFRTDFSNIAVVGKGKAKQVEISLEFVPPETFSDRSTIVWRRYWRDEGVRFVSETFHRSPGRKEIALKSKAIQWLRGIRFRYVPAIKGSDYFAALMRELHDTLAATIDSQLRSAASDFIEVVRSHTEGISEHISEYIQLSSRLQLPENLRSLFEVLDFQTTCGARDISLRLRGDGIKVRHIPAVLKFLSDQERRLSPPGKPRPLSIWGYEEPENNLEFKRAFEHADELFAARESAQIFLTTHSPAFYGLASGSRSNEVWAFNAKPDSGYGTQLARVMPDQVSAFDEELGLMPLVAPYLNQMVEELDGAREALRELQEDFSSVGRPHVVFAGETDALYFKCALELFAPELHSAVDVLAIGKRDKGGSVGTGDSRLFAIIDHWNSKPEFLVRRTVAVLDPDVSKKIASENAQLKVVQMERKPNSVAKSGIENWFPDSVFVDEMYSTKETDIGYGGKKVVREFQKMWLCNAVCKEGGCHYNRREEILAPLKSLIEEVRAHVVQ